VRSLSFRPAALAIRLGCDLDPQSREAGHDLLGERLMGKGRLDATSRN
jgi:hypothetical protein